MDSRPPTSLADVFTSRPMSNLCNGRSCSGCVSAASARRHADRTTRRANERDIHAKDGFDHCGVDLVSVRTVLEGTELNVVNAITQVHCEILPILGECPQTKDTFEVTPSHVASLAELSITSTVSPRSRWIISSHARQRFANDDQ